MLVINIIYINFILNKIEISFLVLYYILKLTLIYVKKIDLFFICIYNHKHIKIMALTLRGLHIDPARRLIPIDIVKFIIKKATQCHINTLHLHLTDDQGIAIENATLDYHGGWTIDEQESIYEECKKHNIDIIPEIDIPGHTAALRSILEKNEYKPITKMGTISKGLLKIEHLPIILQLYTEVAERFHCKHFHMGGDETRGTTKEYFQYLVNEVCIWGLAKGITIIAWEDVLYKIEPPDNLLIHKWKLRTFPPVIDKLNKIGNGRILQSSNYYLDTCIDAFGAYRTKIPDGILGCIACTWGELISEENIIASIFPTLYLLGDRWNNVEQMHDPIPLLYKLCQNLGWIDANTQDTWKRRQWKPFVLKSNATVPPRSSSSTPSTTTLNRPEDKYPLISNFLIKMAYDIYMKKTKNIIPDQDSIKIYKKALSDAKCTENLSDALWDKKFTYGTLKKILNSIQRSLEPEEQVLYKNGLRMIIRECKRNNFSDTA